MASQVQVARQHLFTRPLHGPASYLLAAIAILAPTALRQALDPVMGGGFPFATYYPFVLMAAMLLEWRLALLVGAGATFLGNWIFLGQRFGLATESAEVLGTLFMLASAAAMVLAANGYRRTILAVTEGFQSRPAARPRTAVAASGRPLARGVGLLIGAAMSIALWGGLAAFLMAQWS